MAFRLSSSFGLVYFLRVLPNAASFALVRLYSLMALKKSRSLGLE
jgi:hypothetical protein